MYHDHKDFAHKPLNSWNNLFLKIMFAMQKAMPEDVDHRTLTGEQIVNQNLPCRALESAVEAGMIPKLKGCERRNKEIRYSKISIVRIYFLTDIIRENESYPKLM